jgi:hypothetical protein
MTKIHRLAPGAYETVDVLDSDGKPFTITQASWEGSCHSRVSLWFVHDSRNRLISKHASLRDARGSL